MPVRVDAATATQRWVSGMSNSSDAAKRGVMSVTATDKWLARTQAARDKYQRRVGAVTLGQWQNAMTQYGISRMAQGASQKQAKMQSFMQEYLPFLATGVEQVKSMPKNTLEDSIARATAMIRYNAGFQRGGGG
jgi:hypothetical protein